MGAGAYFPRSPLPDGDGAAVVLACGFAAAGFMAAGFPLVGFAAGLRPAGFLTTFFTAPFWTGAFFDVAGFFMSRTLQNDADPRQSALSRRTCASQPQSAALGRLPTGPPP
jgi:hypothetical protein